MDEVVAKAISRLPAIPDSDPNMPMHASEKNSCRSGTPSMAMTAMSIYLTAWKYPMTTDDQQKGIPIM